MKKNSVAFMMIFLVISFAVISCEENNPEKGSGVLKIRLTDAPAQVEAVNVEINSVQANFEQEETEDGWMELDIENGIYNLLEYQNGIDTLIAEEEVPAGYISQLRLILGNNNTIVVDGDTLDLLTPSANNTGIKINIDQEINKDMILDLTLDFDAKLSIVEQGNGNYLLNPVIILKKVEHQETGSIAVD